MCDVFNIDPTGSCNVITFGDAQINWFSQDISSNYWELQNKYVPPPPPPPTPEEQKVIEEKEEEANPTENNEWAEWNWLQKREKDPCEGRDDCVWDCVQASEIPTEYKKSKDMSIGQGKCGFKFQLTNGNEKAPFTVTILRNGGMSLTMPLLAAAAATISLW